MKGGDVIMVQALRALDGGRRARDDERHGGHDRRRGIVRRPAVGRRARRWSPPRKGAQVAIGFEDGDGHPQHAVIGRRGTASWTLKVTGTPAHSSQIFRDDIGFGAVFEAARILDAFRQKLAGQEHLTFNPGRHPRRHADDLRRRRSRADRRSAKTTSFRSRRS